MSKKPAGGARSVYQALMPVWIDINERMPTEAETCEGRVAVLDVDGYAMIGIILQGAIFCEMEFTHWCALPARLER